LLKLYPKLSSITVGVTITVIISIIPTTCVYLAKRDLDRSRIKHVFFVKTLQDILARSKGCKKN